MGLTVVVKLKEKNVHCRKLESHRKVSFMIHLGLILRNNIYISRNLLKSSARIIL